MKDPIYDELVQELRRVRTKPGLPGPERLDGAFTLIDELGQGDLMRAWELLEALRQEHGNDADSDIAAYFALAGWDVGLSTLEQRRDAYARTHYCDSRTALRRADRGMGQLARLIRHGSASSRPWVIFALWQSGNHAEVIVRFHMTIESWRPPTIRINDEIQPHDFVLHRMKDRPGWYHSLAVAERVPLDLTAGQSQDMLSAFVHWPMPIWPAWFHVTYAADPRILTTSHVYADRGLSLTLRWSHMVTAAECGDLVSAKRLWAPGSDPHGFEVPEGWMR